ncbi:MAG: hypothetical protein IAG13_00375 [Deltaproteobacteria bacterium]|nr:hypothetical protein [Nannocystaceae bacterium]
MNCQPIVAPDPLNFGVTLSFDNPGGGIGTADVTSARFLLAGVEQVSFDLSPASFGPLDAGDMTTANATKVDGTATPQDGCQTLLCGSDYDVEITLDVDGTEIVATTTVTVECAF